jgi:PAS domain S-box-containing protein
LEGIYSRLWQRVLVVLITNGAKTFAASAVILALFFGMVSRHLIHMAEFARTIVPGSCEPRLTLWRKSVANPDASDELDQVVSAINGLQERTALEIEQRRQAETELRQAEHKYRIVADFTYDWEYWANLDGHLEYVSPACERISGFTPREFQENPGIFRDMLLPEDRAVWDRHFQLSRREPSAQQFQLRIRRKDGEVRWIEHICQPVTDEHGMFNGFRASNRDITNRLRSENDLRQAYTQIQSLTAQLEAESAYLREEIKLEHNYESIIGRSDALKYILYRVEQVAATDATVLILGETGTGKELIARAIHSTGSRSARALVKVNCGALPDNLIDSELFGHEKGAFTGANVQKLGRFELAHQGTLFLDEIGELSLGLQSKLLRVIEDGEFERLGSSKTRKIDVRIIAATNRELENEMKSGRFREDLWYRLNVFTITVPPLRARAEDIPLLVRHYIEQFNKQFGKAIDKVPSGTIQRLQAYPWPGNVRELRHVIERAVINTSGNSLQLEDPLTVSGTPPQSQSATKAAAAPLMSLEQMERQHILTAMAQASWKIEGSGGAAELLDINPGTLRSRMKKLGIQKPR